MSGDKPPKKTDDSRRGFIRGSSLLLASALPGHPAALPELRFGLIGCGRSGQKLAAATLSLFAPYSQSARLVAMADLLPSRLQQGVRGLKSRHSHAFQVASEGRFIGTDSFRHLLERRQQLGLDAVIVATPVPLRASIAYAVASSGLHTYVEQPIARDEAGIHRFVSAVAAAESNGSLLTVGNSRDQRSQLQTICAAVKEGLIGHPQNIMAELFLARTQSKNGEFQVGQGAPQDQRPWHDELAERIAAIDLASCLFDEAIESVVESDNEGCWRTRTVYRTIKDQRLTIAVNDSCVARRPAQIRLHGTRGTCDVSTGRFWDPEKRLIARLQPPQSNRISQLQQELATAFIGGRQPDALRAAQINRMAIS